MNEYILENGLKLIYKKSDSKLSSIAISIDAGAARDSENLGIAHVTEHMVYKGTETRSEEEINEELSKIFAFQNAMTNYPYVVFYGTLLSEDLHKGLELFSDIILEPVFTEKSFSEEMEVIKQELREWDEELEQYTEDKLYYNCMNDRRLKYPIIGTEESLKRITINDAIDFFNEYYCANNATITVISNLDFETVVDLIEENFGHWRSETARDEEEDYEEYEIVNTKPKCGMFIDKKENINSSKVQIIFPIDDLNQWEIKALKVFNQYFGEGVNSLLFDTLRTKNNLVYDVLTKVSNEEYIGVYKITYTTSHENLDKSLDIIKELINDIDKLRDKLSKEDILQFIKSFKLKRLFNDEQTVRLAINLSTYDTMFGDGLLYIDETEDLNKMPVSFIIDTAVKVLSNISVQVITK